MWGKVVERTDILANRAEVQTTAADENQGGRGIASVRPLGQISWENRAFEVLESSGSRDVSSVGLQASPLDALALGSLEGRYAVKLKSNGQLAKVSSKSGKTEIKNRLGFLNQHRSLLGKDVQSVRQVFADQYEGTSLESFDLIAKDGQTVGSVELKIDDEDQLLSMSVQ